MALQATQSAVSNIQDLLTGGRLEEAVPAVLQADEYINQQTESWMLKSPLFVAKRVSHPMPLSSRIIC